MLRFPILAAAALLPLAAQADGERFYVGAGYTDSDYRLSSSAVPFDDRDRGWKLLGGWRLHRNFALEASYADHGDLSIPTGIVCVALVDFPCPSTVRADAQTASLFAVGIVDLQPVELFAKAGINAWNFDGRVAGPSAGFSFSEDGTGFAWGAGAQVRFGALGVRAEYERFDVIRDEDIGVVSLSLTWNF